MLSREIYVLLYYLREKAASLLHLDPLQSRCTPSPRTTFDALIEDTTQLRLIMLPLLLLNTLSTSPRRSVFMLVLFFVRNNEPFRGYLLVMRQ